MNKNQVITTDMLAELRRKHNGVIVADDNGVPKVRSQIHYDGPDPLDTGEQTIVIDHDPAHDQELPDVTGDEIAADLTERWPDLVAEAWLRADEE